MKVILTGSTGFIGREVLDQCLQNSSITSVVVLSRRELPVAVTKSNPKLNVVIMDDFLLYPDHVLQQVEGADACIWALGKAVVSTDEEARKISLGYTLAAARALDQVHTSKNGKKLRFVYLSGKIVETDQTKRLWYMQTHRRIGGQVITELVNFANDRRDAFETYVMKPSMVLSKKMSLVETTCSYLIPTVKVGVLANAMIGIAMDGNKQQTFENHDICCVGV